MSRPDPGPDASHSAAPPHWYSPGLNRLFYYRIAQAAASALPRPARLRLARGLGGLLSRAMPAERRAVRSNLARVMAGTPPRELDRRVSETFANFGVFFNFFDAWSPPHGRA